MLYLIHDLKKTIPHFIFLYLIHLGKTHPFEHIEECRLPGQLKIHQSYFYYIKPTKKLHQLYKQKQKIPFLSN